MLMRSKNGRGRRTTAEDEEDEEEGWKAYGPWVVRVQGGVFRLR
jgi:hypothetical protein